MTDILEPLLNQQQAAEHLKISVRTLERLRVAGTTPKYIKLGRLVRYRPTDLVEWIDTHARDSTSDTGAVA